MKRVFSLAVGIFCILFIGSISYANIKVYISPSMIFFADSVGFGATVGSDIEVGYSKFSPSDSISVSPELSFNFSQTTESYFSYLSIKVIPAYEALLFSFEKRNSIFLKLGIGVGFSILNVSVGSLSHSGLGLVFEPVFGILYNFLENLWTFLDFRYLVVSDVNGKITSIVSPSIVLGLAIQF